MKPEMPLAHLTFDQIVGTLTSKDNWSHLGDVNPDLRITSVLQAC